MVLKEWQKKYGVSNIELAQSIGVHFSYITHINKGRRIPSPDTALKIQKVTNGKVSVLELLYPPKKDV